MTPLRIASRAESLVLHARNRLYGRPVAGPDRMWGSASVVTAVGPVVVPARVDLVRAIRQLAEFPEMTRVGWLSTRQGRGWKMTSDLDSFADDCVELLDDASDENPAAAGLRVLNLGRAGLPFRFYAGRQALYLNVAHASADGYSMTRLLAAVFETARRGQPPLWVMHPPVHLAVTKATVNFFRRNPHQLRALAARSRTSPAPGHAIPVAGWMPSVASRFRVSSQETFRELKAWRKEHCSGISTVPLTICATELALRRLGIQTTSEPLVVVDARRYLRERGPDIAGNFCAGLRMRLEDRGDPVALDRAIKDSVASGRPLAVLAAGSLRSYRGPVAEHSSLTRTETAWDLAYSHMGRPPEIMRLPWLSGSVPPYYMGILTPAGPNGVTMGYTEVRNRVTTFASFHDNVVDTNLVEQVLDLVCTDPVELLEEHRVKSAAANTLMEEVPR